MKVLKISLVTFALLVGFTVVNFLYINHVCDTMTAYVEDAAASYRDAAVCRQKTDIILGYWQKHRKICSLSVPTPTIDRIDELLISLSAYNEAENPSEVLNTARLLVNAVADLGHLERFCIENIM